MRQAHRMRLRSGWIGLATLSVLLVGSATFPDLALAVPDEGMRRGAHSEHDRDMHDFVGHSFSRLLLHAKDLGLSEDQVNKVRTQAAEYEKTRIRGEADLKLAEVDVQALVHDDKADMGAIENGLKKSEAAHTALRLAGIKALRGATAVLTPEQREKWRTSMASRHGGEKGEGEYSEPPKKERK